MAGGEAGGVSATPPPGPLPEAERGSQTASVSSSPPLRFGEEVGGRGLGRDSHFLLIFRLTTVCGSVIVRKTQPLPYPVPGEAFLPALRAPGPANPGGKGRISRTACRGIPIHPRHGKLTVIRLVRRLLTPLRARPGRSLLVLLLAILGASALCAPGIAAVLLATFGFLRMPRAKVRAD